MALLERHVTEAVAHLHMNAPDRLNALSDEMLAALQSEFDHLMQDRSVRAVILSGAGKAFCAGHDLKQMTQARQAEDGGRAYFAGLFDRCSTMMQTIRALPQPVIAQVHGIATAAGCQLVAACDLAVAADTATFATNGISNGLFCSTPSVALARNVARKHAFEMLFTGDFISAARAMEIGLINRTAAEDQLDEETRLLAERIAEKSTVTTRSGKAMFYKQLGMDLGDAYAFAAENMACDMMSDDAGEGLDAFIEKRQPVWRDR